MSIPKLDTALAVNANTPGAAKYIIQSVIFIVAANTDSKNDTIGLFTSPTFASAIANIRTNTMIGTMSPDANECIGLFGINPKNMSKNKGLNRIKVVLAEKQCTNKWLAEQLDKGEATISKWCTNRAQPSLETLVEIANVLQVDVKDLLQSTVQESDMVFIKIPKSKL